MLEKIKKYGNFSDYSLGKLFGYAHHKPVVIAGSGPSLKVNAMDLKDRRDITVVSCLHNFHFMEDIGLPC